MKEVITYNITDSAITEMESNYMSLKVSGVDDKDGFKKVCEARKDVRKHRMDVETVRKGLKADSLAWGRKVDSEAKRITEKLIPMETYLKTQEDIVKKEKKRIEEEKARQIIIIRDNRAGELAKYEAEFDGVLYRCGFEMVKAADLGIIDDEIFFTLLEKAKETKQRKDDQEAEVAFLKKEEEDRQAKIAEDNRKKQDELKAQQDEIERKEKEQIEKENERLRKEKQIEMNERKNTVVELLVSLGFKKNDHGYNHTEYHCNIGSKAYTELDDDSELDDFIRETNIRHDRCMHEIEQIKEKEKQHAIELEVAKKKAAEDERDRLEKEQIEKDKKAEEDRLAELKRIAEEKQAEKERLAEEERQKPDKEKLLKFLLELHAVDLPDVKTKKALNLKRALKREIELVSEKYQDKLK